MTVSVNDLHRFIPHESFRRLWATPLAMVPQEGDSTYSYQLGYYMNTTVRLLLVGMLVASRFGARCHAQAASSRQINSAHDPAAIKPKQPLHQYRFYAGAHVAAQVFRVVSTTYPIQEAVVRPLYMFAGFQLGPHWALQAGFLQHRLPVIDESGVQLNYKGEPVAFKTYYNEYNAAVPLVLRYDLARHPPHRLHVDVLLGLTLVAHRYQNDYVAAATASFPRYEQHDYARSNNLFATGGVGLGCRVVSHVDLMVEATTNRNLTAMNSGYAKQFMFGVGAGLRYSFNLSSKPYPSTTR